MSAIFNSIPLTGLTASLASCMSIAPPQHAGEPIPMLCDHAERTCGGRAVSRVLMYNADAVGQWLFQKYTPDFGAVLAHTQLALPLLTSVPSYTPVCFATMYSGVSPEVHGIRRYERPVLTVDTLFDALARAGKRAAIISSVGCSMSIIFNNRQIDYFVLADDDEVTAKSLELIEANQHDFLAVYHDGYDSTMHKTTPESPEALAQMRRHTATFGLLSDAIEKHWSAHDRLIGFAPDHGIHLSADGHGTHGENVPEDMNIMHFYGVREKKG